MRPIGTRVRLCGVGIGLLAALQAGSAAATPADVSFSIELGASTSVEPPTGGLTPNGEAVTVPSLTFYAKVRVTHQSGSQPASATLRVRLGDGLRWGADGPDPTEGCTGTTTTGECALGPYPANIPTAGNENFWWDVVAMAPGRYTYSGELVDLSDTDRNPGNNSSTITIIVAESSGGGGSGGSAAASASAARVTPARPRAGGLVTAAVRVRAGGAAIRPTRVACTGTIGRTRVRGTPRAASGVASCRYRPPPKASGRTLRGSVSFTARGQRFTRRFSARLG